MDLDPSLISALPVPTGSKITLVARHGQTNWSTGLRIDVAVNGEVKSFFAKLIDGKDVVGMAEAEFEGQKAIHAIIPEHAPAPIAWGYYQNDQNKAWFLTHFRLLEPATIDESQLVSKLLPVITKLHHTSVSPTGKFGFHGRSFYGPVPMTVGWTASWEEFWADEFRSSLTYTQRMRGDDAELMQVATEFLNKVVPRLLRPLQTGGRTIKPSLCHGDLWDGNIQVDTTKKELVLFDPCPFYGHAEMDLQCMREKRYALGRLGFAKKYGEEVGISEPVEDFDDRVALYSIRNDILTYGMHPGRSPLLDNAKEEMRCLITKHPRGLAGFRGDLTPSKTFSHQARE